ncbi:MAG TPA: hemolysin family protein [Dehalococcoidia bacterium]|nr:hemolysin family protein [Dehalococcoidia bacterium]
MDTVLIPLLITVGLIALNGLFVAAEFAIIGTSRPSVEQRAKKGDRLASLVSGVLQNPQNQDRYIATAQIGITFASLGLGMYVEHQFAHWIASGFDSLGQAQWILSHSLATVLAILIITYFHIVFGEMIPKSLALQRAERTALLVSPPMLALKYAFYPLVVGLNGIGNTVLKLVGVDRSSGGNEQFYSPEELQLVVRESLEGGLLRSESGNVIRELFDFPELTAGGVMVPRVRIKGIQLGAESEALKELMRESPHTRYPVYKENLDHIVGMLHAKDLLRIITSGASVEERTLRAIRYVPETTHLDVTLAALRENESQMVIVMDEHGGTAGLITTEDLYEELIGEVEEEQSSPQMMTWVRGGLLSVDGAVRLEDVGEEFGLELVHEEVDTVSGLVLMLLDRPPNVGDRVTYEGLSFQVTKVEGHGVERCMVSRLPGAARTDDAGPA